ncbi:MAG: dynamin family protein [Leptolyngbya sp. Prado105]|jgi:SLT domain-containing protein|nr:dynamin family protein [Leptolyngbya sp. Prado105]
MSIQSQIEIIKSAIGTLELPPNHPIRQDLESISQRDSDQLRVAIFAPFNYGKSTLLNAMLGERALPIDIIPTTGAAIRVQYGDTLETAIQFQDDLILRKPGTDLLKQFAILDHDRRMREDVKSVEVFCPHPLLKTGVEFVDLPGTDDRDAQDALVKNQLLGADVIIQVLDGRKLMTLGEREQLRDWLLDRGITTVVFVVNFLNLLESEDQLRVYHRLRFVAESFRSHLPSGVSNLYRVDALPALRARLKGDSSAAKESGLPIFESALQTIAAHFQASRVTQTARIQSIARQIQHALQPKIRDLESEILSETETLKQRFQIQQKAQGLVQKGFESSLEEFRDWLSLDRLLSQYQIDASLALQTNSFKIWETGDFKRSAINYQQALIKWVHQACEFFDQPRPNQLLITFPTMKQDLIQVQQPDDSSPLDLLLGRTIASIMRESASFLFDDQPLRKTNPQELLETCQDRIQSYFTHFSQLNLAAISQYEQAARPILQFEIKPIASETAKHYQLQLLRSQLAKILEISESHREY